MRAQVTHVPGGSPETLVRFSTPWAEATARWGSSLVSPECGCLYDAELDVEVAADLSQNTRLVSHRIATIREGHAEMVICGTVEALDDDGLAYLRMAVDCLIPVETRGGIAIGDCIELRLPPGAITVTPIGAPIRSHGASRERRD